MDEDGFITDRAHCDLCRRDLADIAATGPHGRSLQLTCPEHGVRLEWLPDDESLGVVLEF